MLDEIASVINKQPNPEAQHKKARSLLQRFHDDKTPEHELRVFFRPSVNYLTNIINRNK
jgi:hypothetical protein